MFGAHSTRLNARMFSWSNCPTFATKGHLDHLSIHTCEVGHFADFHWHCVEEEIKHVGIFHLPLDTYWISKFYTRIKPLTHYFDISNIVLYLFSLNLLANSAWCLSLLKCHSCYPSQRCFKFQRDFIFLTGWLTFWYSKEISSHVTLHIFGHSSVPTIC